MRFGGWVEELLRSFFPWALYDKFVRSFTTGLTIQEINGKVAETIQSREVGLACP